MYCKFFGLHTLPFNNTPDPRFFFNTPDHEEALASLLYAAQGRKGFVLISGEVGSGKTLLSRLLVTKLGSSARTAVITNTRLAGHELLSAVCREFKLSMPANAGAADLSLAIEAFLLDQYARDRLAVVVLDEAQNLPMEAFEELRMLSNLEADDAKLLQILMLGQPEVRDAFQAPSMRQLQQRIFRTFHLGGLNEDLTGGYIRHRLRVAGLPEGEEIFAADSIRVVYEHSRGIPRLVNHLCDNALLAAYTDSSRQVSALLVHEAAEQMLAVSSSDATSEGRGPEPVDQTGDDRRTGGRPVANRHRDAQATNAKDGQKAAWSSDVAAAERRLANVLQQSLQSAAVIEKQAEETLKRAESKTQETEERMRRLLEETSQANESARGRLEETIRASAMAASASEQRARSFSENVVKSAESAQKQTAEMLRQTQAAAQQVDERGRRILEDAAQVNESSQNRMEEAIQTVEAAASAGEQRVRSSCEEAAKTAESAQKQTAEMLRQTQAAAQQVDERVRRILEDAAQVNESSQNRMEEAIQTVEAAASAGEQRVRSSCEEAGKSAEIVRNQAANVLNTAASVRKAEERVREVLEDSNRAFEQARERSGQLLQATQMISQEGEQRINEALERAVQLAEATQNESQGILGRINKAGVETDKRLHQTLQQAEGVAERLQKQTKALHAEAADQKKRLDAQAGRLLDGLEASAERHCARLTELLAEEEGELDGARQAHLQAAEALKRAEASDQAAADSSRTQREELQERRDQAQELAAQMEARVEELGRKSSETLAAVERQIEPIRLQLDDIRGSARARVDEMSAAMEAIMQQTKQRVEGSQRQLQDAAGLAQGEIQAMRQTLQVTREQMLADAEVGYGRSATLWEQVEHGAQQVREDAGRVLDQAQTAAASVRQHAGELLSQARTDSAAILERVQGLLTQARSNSDGVSEQAAGVLRQAQDSAEQFRQHAEALLQRAAAAAEDLQAEVGDRRVSLHADVSRMQENFAVGRQELAASRHEVLEIVEHAKELHQDARGQAEMLLRRAGEANDRAAELVRIPRELIEETGRRAVSLSEVSQKVSVVVQQLASANSRAEDNEASLREAASVVDQKLEQLKHHAARVGQLLGLIRQLYGTMDARIGRLRNRLGEADGIFRNVPQELDCLRRALTEEMDISASLGIASENDLLTVPSDGGGLIDAALSRGASAEVTARQSPRHTAARPRQQAASVAAPSTSVRQPAPPSPQNAPLTHGSLGQRAARNKKLNEWLRDVLGEEGIKAGPNEPRDAPTERPTMPEVKVAK